jgi:hypothetical protein
MSGWRLGKPVLDLGLLSEPPRRRHDPYGGNSGR